MKMDETTRVLTLDAHESLCLELLVDAVIGAVEEFNCTTQRDWEDKEGLLRNQPLFSALCRLRTHSRIYVTLHKETKDA